MAGNGAPLNFKILTFRLRHIETEGRKFVRYFCDFRKLAAVDFTTRSVRNLRKEQAGRRAIKFSGEMRLINFKKSELSGYNCVFCG